MSPSPYLYRRGGSKKGGLSDVFCPRSARELRDRFFQISPPCKQQQRRRPGHPPCPPPTSAPPQTSTTSLTTSAAPPAPGSDASSPWCSCSSAPPTCSSSSTCSPPTRRRTGSFIVSHMFPSYFLRGNNQLFKLNLEDRILMENQWYCMLTFFLVVLLQIRCYYARARNVV